MIGVSRGCERARGTREIAVRLYGLGQEQMHLLHDAADTRGEDYPIAHVPLDLIVECLGLAL